MACRFFFFLFPLISLLVYLVSVVDHHIPSLLHCTARALYSEINIYSPEEKWLKRNSSALPGGKGGGEEKKVVGNPPIVNKLIIFVMRRGIKKEEIRTMSAYYLIHLYIYHARS